jgi:hypothetical protein
MKSITVCLVVRVMSGGSAEYAESVLSIRRIWRDEAHRHESPNRRAPLLSDWITAQRVARSMGLIMQTAGPDVIKNS